MKSAGMAADSRVEISARPIPQEPMVCGIFLLLPIGLSLWSNIVPHHESRDIAELRKG